MFNARTFILLAIAAILALLAAFMAHRIVTNAKPVPTPAVETTPIVVALSEIPYLARVKDSDVRVIQFPKNLLPAGVALPDGMPLPKPEAKPNPPAATTPGDVSSFYFAKDPTEVVGKIATQSIYPGEMLVKQRVRDNLGGNPLASIIPEGYRAVTLRVNEASGVAGFLLAGNKVDILLTKRAGDKVQSQVIERQVEILAVDQEPSKDKDKPMVVRTVTLSLPVREAEKVIRSAEEGGLYMMLRNQTDATAPPVPGDEKEAVGDQPQAVPVTLIKGRTAFTVNCTRSTCAN